MRLYTCYSESHRVLFNNYFCPSLPTEIEIDATHVQQIGDGNYMNSGWKLSTMEKIKIMLRAVNENEYFIWSDCDVIFFGPITDILLSELGDHELACQNESRGIYGSGFFICKSTVNTRKLFDNMLNIMVQSNDLNDDDEKCLNRLVQNCRSKFLSDLFWNVGLFFENNGYPIITWSNQDFQIPQDIVVFHANWTVGVENKIRLLELVKMKKDGKIF